MSKKRSFQIKFTLLCCICITLSMLSKIWSKLVLPSENEKAENQVQYVYYSSYGSNLSLERLRIYLNGGIPMGAKRAVEGCRDSSDPLQDEFFSIPHNIVFAKESSTWERGVCFINPIPDSNNSTIARRYLITLEQFNDILAQENRKPVGYEYVQLEHINEAYNKRSAIQVFKTGWYNHLLPLGKVKSRYGKFPVATFTCSPEEFPRLPFNAPSESYLDMLRNGLQESDYDDTWIEKYLESILAP